MEDQFSQFFKHLRATIPSTRLIDDPFQRTAMAHDASFYRLVPRLIVVAESETEIQTINRLAQKYNVSITYRASGTSLSGQSVTDAVLVKLGENWKRYSVEQSGQLLKAQPGLLGGEANQILLAHARCLAPQPASLAAASLGGIAANNASGMNSLDTYQFLTELRVILANGDLLDTADQSSRVAFTQTNANLIQGIARLRDDIRNTPSLRARVQHKYRMKNTMGYNLRAFLDADEPIEIIKRLLIGSEGTLGFIAEITQKTIPVQPHLAAAWLVFDDLDAVGLAIQRLKESRIPIAAAELLDAHALQAAAQLPDIGHLNDWQQKQGNALLVQLECETSTQLAAAESALKQTLLQLPSMRAPHISRDRATMARWWTIRKGILPSIGAQRPCGTTSIIEDVCYPIAVLPEALRELRALLDRFGYGDAVIFGHALAGNMHFVFSQSFESEQERERYRLFIEALAEHVVKNFDGSLKAEHGTGRNMAPYVHYEWGDDAYRIMRRIKTLFDPHNILNPNVILSDDPSVHLKHLKPLSATHSAIDACIECGFCERMCPSQFLTLTPRQRIVALRELSHVPPESQSSKTIDYYLDKTCAGCGLCETACPVSINTGEAVRQYRYRHRKGDWLAQWIAAHFGVTTKLITWSWNIARPLSVFRRRSATRMFIHHGADNTEREPLLYFSACGSRMLGSLGTVTVQSVTERVLNEAGFTLMPFDEQHDLCCGQAFNSKGFFTQAQKKQEQLLERLLEKSNHGERKIYCDSSSCTQHLIAAAKARGLKLYDSTDFIERFVLPKLSLTKLEKHVAIHVTCSTIQMQQSDALERIARQCATHVVRPTGSYCCGFAGDKGIQIPQLNAHALKSLSAQVQHCCAGYSSNTTCELGLTRHSGIDYQSIIFLVAESAGLVQSK